MSAHAFPVVRGHLPYQVLRNQLSQHLGDTGEVRLVVLELDTVDECGQLEDLVARALVVAAQVFGEFLRRNVWDRGAS